MPQRSAVSQLPEATRKALEQKLLHGGFSGYTALSAWLADEGYEISKSAIHRFGQSFERRLAALKTATDQAKAIAAASQDDAGDMNEALIRLVQTQTFDILVALNSADAAENLPKIGRMVAELARASINQKKWAEAVHAKVAAKFAEMEQQAGAKSGLDAATLAHVKAAIYGIV